MKPHEMTFVKTTYLIKENTSHLQTTDCTVINVVKQQLGQTLCDQKKPPKRKQNNTQEFKENVPRSEEGRKLSITGPKVGDPVHDSRPNVW